MPPCLMTSAVLRGTGQECCRIPRLLFFSWEDGVMGDAVGRGSQGLLSMSHQGHTLLMPPLWTSALGTWLRWCVLASPPWGWPPAFPHCPLWRKVPVSSLCVRSARCTLYTQGRGIWIIASFSTGKSVSSPSFVNLLSDLLLSAWILFMFWV